MMKFPIINRLFPSFKWKVGEIKDTSYMQEAYNMGKMV